MLSTKEISAILTERLRESCRGHTVLCRELLRLLALGQPVTVEQLAQSLHSSEYDVRMALHQLHKIEYDPQGRIVAAGLSLRPTLHRFQSNGQDLFTWCAFDTLAYPVILQQSALIESRCPVSNKQISLTVTPTSISSFDLTHLYMSLVLPQAEAISCDIRASFCNHVYFLSSMEVAEHWQTENPTAFILPVIEAYKIANRVAQQVYLVDNVHTF